MKMLSSQIKLNKILTGIVLAFGAMMSQGAFANQSCSVDTLSAGTYVGACVNGKAHGQGTYTWADGRKYVGAWENGEKNGQGTMTWPDGDKYVGAHVNNKAHGQGTYTWADGDKYVGAHVNGKGHGQGTYTWADGRKYVGAWENGEKNGQGTMTWPDGRKYVGGWKENDYHGFGTLSFPKDGSYNWYKERGYGSLQGGRYVVEGEWESDEFVASCKPNRQACDKGREIHRKKEAEIAQKQAEAEEKRRRAEQAQEPSMFFVNFSCTACEAQILSLSTPSGTSPTFTNSTLDKQVGVYRLSNNSSFKGTYHFRVQLTKWGGQDIQICSGSFTKNDNTKEAGFLIDYYSCNISKIH